MKWGWRGVSEIVKGAGFLSYRLLYEYGGGEAGLAGAGGSNGVWVPGTGVRGRRDGENLHSGFRVWMCVSLEV